MTSLLRVVPVPDLDGRNDILHDLTGPELEMTRLDLHHSQAINRFESKVDVYCVVLVLLTRLVNQLRKRATFAASS
jgi:hypothetical protein